MKDIPTQVDGVTSLPAADFNQIPDELENLITKAGLTLDGVDLDQLSKAISIYSAGGAFYTDSGIVDAYVLSPVGTKLAPEAYFDGMKVAFFLTTPNTGASTVNVNGIGVKNIVDPSGTALNAGDLDDYVELVYILGSDEFRLIETAGGAAELQSQLSQAWVSFNGTGTVAINDSFNVSSITDNATGDYTVNFASSLPNADFVAATSGRYLVGGTGTNTVQGDQVSPNGQTVNDLRLACGRTRAGFDGGDDMELVNVVVFANP